MRNILIELESNVGRNLEQLVDANGLQAVIECLADICDAKAEHINHNWQDRALANAWTRNAGKLQTCARHLTPTE